MRAGAGAEVVYVDDNADMDGEGCSVDGGGERAEVERAERGARGSEGGTGTVLTCRMSGRGASRERRGLLANERCMGNAGARAGEGRAGREDVEDAESVDARDVVDAAGASARHMSD